MTMTGGREGRFAKAFVLIALIAGGLARSAVAQDADTAAKRDTATFQLQPIEVIGSIVPAAGPGIASGVPARVSVLAGREIDAWEPRLLADALASLAGVSFYDDLGSPYKLNLSTRGFVVGPTLGLPPGVSVFLDGVRQNEPDAQEVNFDLLPMEHVERVELLSGTGSLLGPNSLGGAVNLVTRRGRGEPSGEIELSGGSFGAFSAEGSLGGRSSGGWDYYLGGGYEREDGWRDATGAQSWNGFLNLGRLGAARGATLQLFAAESRAETAGSLPESLFESAPKTNFTAGDFEDLNLQQFSLAGYAPIGTGRASLRAYFRRSEGERFNVNQPPEDDVRAFATNRSVGGTADWRWTSPLRGSTLSVRLGADAAANWVDIRIFEEQRGQGEGEITTDVESPSLDLAGFAIADLRVGRTTLSAGARYDYVRIPFRNLLDPAGDTTSTYGRLSPRGGVSIAVEPDVSLYASVGASFRAPAILELACADPEAACPLPFALGEDPPLDPVTAVTFELGGRWALGPVAIDASAYRTEVRDEIFFVPSEASPVEGFFRNVERTRREGVELSARVDLGAPLSAYVGYAYTRATFRSAAELFSVRADDDFEDSPLSGPNDVHSGDRMPLVPDHQLKLGGLTELPGGFDIGLDARLVGAQWLRGDEANETEPLDTYFVANVRAGWAFAQWEIEGIVSNVFDSRRPIFGTFNENGLTGELERFLSPLNARALKVIVRRNFGQDADR
ncbi:MAG: TonB-dependent receptor [Gemmatimonadota bacterium]